MNQVKYCFLLLKKHSFYQLKSTILKYAYKWVFILKQVSDMTLIFPVMTQNQKLQLNQEMHQYFLTLTCFPVPQGSFYQETLLVVSATQYSQPMVLNVYWIIWMDTIVGIQCTCGYKWRTVVNVKYSCSAHTVHLGTVNLRGNTLTWATQITSVL